MPIDVTSSASRSPEKRSQADRSLFDFSVGFVDPVFELLPDFFRIQIDVVVFHVNVESVRGSGDHNHGVVFRPHDPHDLVLFDLSFPAAINKLMELLHVGFGQIGFTSGATLLPPDNDSDLICASQIHPHLASVSICEIAKFIGAVGLGVGAQEQ